VLPQAYELPAVALLILGGIVACFAGYRLFRFVLAIYGFIVGAMLASSTMGITSTAGMVAAALLGGVLGALILVFAYFIGIALVGAGLGVFVAHVLWAPGRSGDPPAVAIIVAAVLGAVLAMVLQRYVIVLATAFGGAWTIIVGALALGGDRATARAALTGDVWILYPTSPAPGQRWVPMAWLVLGLLGTGVQLAVTGRRG
jgi:hypothetical protein